MSLFLGDVGKKEILKGIVHRILDTPGLDAGEDLRKLIGGDKEILPFSKYHDRNTI
jgi:hypothetical protein